MASIEGIGSSKPAAEPAGNMAGVAPKPEKKVQVVVEGSAEGDAHAPQKKQKRTSIQRLQDLFSTSRMESTSGKRKRSLRDWEGFKTVSWRMSNETDPAMRKKIREFQSFYVDDRSNTFTRWEIYNFEAQQWYIPALVGVLTACSGAFIEKTVDWLGALRFGYCPSQWVYVTEETCKDWVPWHHGYLGFVIVCTLLCTISAGITWAFAPMARGSGIPEIKTILGGFSMPSVLEFNTLVVKVIGLSLSVAAGLACGKEGPLVHIACCWSNCLAKYFTRYSNNEAKQRELLSCACAAGVAVAFGAPLGGVLFSFEEASTIFPNITMIRAFFASSVAAMTLAGLDPTGTGKLTMFEMEYKEPPAFLEYIPFLLLGVIGGCVGALFVHLNIIVSLKRKPKTPWRKRVHIVLEVALIGCFTALTSYHLIYTRVLSNVTIRALFHSCTDTDVDRHSFMLDICDGTEPKLETELIFMVLLAGFLRYVQMIFTFGCGAPSGLFIPSLFAGASIGRVVGYGMYLLNEKHPLGLKVQPGIYAMVGAASVLGGVCRVTISLVVIMFELTSGLQLIVPFMLACLTAWYVGNKFTPGIYDYCITIRKYPYLHEPDEVMYSHTAREVMDEEIDCLHPEGGPVKTILDFIKKLQHGGYPLTTSEKDRTLWGYLHTTQLQKTLEAEREKAGGMGNPVVCFKKFLPEGKQMPPQAVDLSDIVDETFHRVVPETNATHLQKMFRNLGIRMIMVERQGKLAGMITKKSFIAHLEELHKEDDEAKKKKAAADAAGKGNVPSNQAPLLPK